MIRNQIAAASCIVFATVLAARGEELPVPTGQVILTISGDIMATNFMDVAEFDLEMLSELGEVTVETSTPWTDGVQTFTGVPLARLADELGVTEGTLQVTAFDNHVADIPLTDLEEGGPIIAYLNNGSPMPSSTTGPLWVVYPYDANPSYRSAATYQRSVWQLVQIHVERN